MTEKPCRLEDLADELISEILSFLLGPEELSNSPSPVSPQEHMAGLNAQPAHVYGEGSELNRFRLVCKRFLRISTPRKFRSFVVRFSRNDFQRLEELLRMQLACHVKSFTYMVRPFYQGSGWSRFIDESGPNRFSSVHKFRLQEQQHILDGNHDRELLREAIVAFSSLQKIKLLRLQDEADQQFLDRVHGRSLEGTLALDWEPACSRAVTNLGLSLLASDRTSVQFVGPQISPEAMVRLLHAPSVTISALGARLACLDVTFYSKANPTSLMEPLSRVFHDFFLAAKNLVTLHLGFSGDIPLDLPLEHIFHRIQFKSLRTLSIQGWLLASDEIIALVSRHRGQLRDIRLVNIYLREGSRWRDVLSALHDDMDEIEQIDLREINYASALSNANGINGHNIGHGISNGHGNSIGTGSAGLYTPPLSVVANHNTPSLHRAVLNTDYLLFAPRAQSRRSLVPAKLEPLRNLTADDLGDDGVCVNNEQRLQWERWVLSGPSKVSQRRN
ncbi:F-box domain protein [Aspergillus egyptiacus]|nr:F-box domain protein [Aspergillus egyptiacus]